MFSHSFTSTPYNNKNLNKKVNQNSISRKREINHRGNNFSRNNLRRNSKRLQVSIQPNVLPIEKSIYLYINLHGAIENMDRNNNRKIEDSFVKVVFPENLRHLTKISIGTFGCINHHSYQDSFNRISKVSLNLEQVLNKEKTLYEVFLESQNDRIKSLIDSLKYIGIIIKSKKKSLNKLHTMYVNIKNSDESLEQTYKEYIKSTRESLNGLYNRRKQLLKQYNIIKRESFKFYSDFEYDKEHPSTKNLYNKYFERYVSNHKLTPPLMFNSEERLMFTDKINSILSDKNIFILHDSLKLLKLRQDIQGLNNITTQELINLLVDMGYTHIYLLDFSCNSLYYKYDNNNQNNIRKHQNFNRFQESIHTTQPFNSNYSF